MPPKTLQQNKSHWQHSCWFRCRCHSPWHCICRVSGLHGRLLHGRVWHPNLQVLILRTCTRCVWHSWVLILKVASTLSDLKSEYYLCSLISRHICSGEMYFSHSLDDIGDVLRKTCDHDSDAMHSAQAAQVVRRGMFKSLRGSPHFMGHSRKDAREMLYHNHF